MSFKKSELPDCKMKVRKNLNVRKNIFCKKDAIMT